MDTVKVPQFCRGAYISSATEGFCNMLIKLVKLKEMNRRAFTIFFNTIWIAFCSFVMQIERTKLLKFENLLKELNCLARLSPFSLTYRSKHV